MDTGHNSKICRRRGNSMKINESCEQTSKRRVSRNSRIMRNNDADGVFSSRASSGLVDRSIPKAPHGTCSGALALWFPSIPSEHFRTTKRPRLSHAQNVHDLRMNHDEPLRHAYVGTLWMHWYNFIHNIHKHSYAVFICVHCQTHLHIFAALRCLIPPYPVPSLNKVSQNDDGIEPWDARWCQHMPVFCANAKH